MIFSDDSEVQYGSLPYISMVVFDQGALLPGATVLFVKGPWSYTCVADKKDIERLRDMCNRTLATLEERFPKKGEQR